MSKYTLINCYSDYNKGDLGIILATYDYIKENDNSADITGVSTYNYSDPMYFSDHELLKKTMEVYPSVFGELNIGHLKNRPIKVLRFLLDTVRILLIMILPVDLVIKIFFSKQEKKTINRIKQSDYIVSKGGSFLCNESSLISKIGLIRFCYIFFLSFRLNKKVIILGQSIGPVNGKISKSIINYLLSKCEKIVLREEDCVTNYPYLNYPANTIVLNDIAFFLKSAESPLIFNKDQLNVGITSKLVNYQNDNYLQMMKDVVEYILQNYENSVINFFPHVSIDNDIESSWRIYKLVEDKFKHRIRLFSNNYSANELKAIYGQMNIFIGTRLHSTIFAMGEFVPSICVAYHGTKAQGIFRNLKSSHFVVQDYNSEVIIDCFKLLFNNLPKQHNALKLSLLNYKNLYNQHFLEIFQK